MQDETHIKKTLLTRFNFILVIGTYLFVSIFLSVSIFSESNLALPDLSDKIYTFFIVILLFAPLASLLVLACFLRLKHYQQTKDFRVIFSTPWSETYGFRDIKFGPKGKKTLRVLRIAAVTIILLSAIFSPVLLIWITMK